jgi:hypothetical protein
VIKKRAYEQFYYIHSFRRGDGRGWLNSLETISTADVKIFDSLGADQTASMISGTEVYQNTKVRFILKAGTAGGRYFLQIRADTSNSQKFEDNGYINSDLIVEVT